MKSIFTFLFLFIASDKLLAQDDLFDTPTITALIEHNKQNYSDHQDLRNKQILSQASVSAWKDATNKMKSLVDGIDKRMNSFFIITADVSTSLHIYKSIDAVLSYQQQALSIASKYPWLVAWAANTEGIIISDATDLFGFVSLIVISYGDMNKISVASRKQIYTELDHQLAKIVQDAQFLVTKLKMVDFAEVYKNTPQWQFVNNDKKLVDGILSSFKY